MGAKEHRHTRRVRLSASGDVALDVYIGSEADPRFKIYADGGLGWGDGSGSDDVWIHRNGPGELVIDNDLLVSGNLIADNVFPYTNQLSADTSTITSTTLATIHTVTLPVGTYTFDVWMPITTVGTSVVPGFALGGTSVPTSWRWIALVGSSVGTVQSGTTTWPGSTSGAGGATVASASTLMVQVKGLVSIGTAGTLLWRMSKVSGGTSVKANNGSLFNVHGSA